MGTRLLLVEDDPAIARTVAYAFEREGLAVTHSLLLGDARAQLRGACFDLLVLDVGLPDGNGLDLLRELRRGAHPTLPVLMLSAHGEEIDRVLGLELGADDYLPKPFSPRELAARVKALLRRAAAPAAAAPRSSTTTRPASASSCTASRSRSRGANTACCPRCSRARAASTRATRCSPPPGATTARAPTAPWTPTSRPCAPSCAKPTRRASTSARTGAWGTAWMFEAKSASSAYLPSAGSSLF